MANILLSPFQSDHYGFYEVGDAKTYSKFEFMYRQSQMPGHWKWNYNDEFFASYDWTKEPTETINELYRQRAQELRNQYDYLVVYYSGGYDSSNLLYAFLDNNIHVDEVCVFYSSLDTVGMQYEEIKLVTKQKVDILKQKYPDLHVRMLDYSQEFFSWDQILTESGYRNDIIDMMGAVGSLNRLILNNTHRSVKDWKQIIESGRKLAWVQGYDKPRVRYVNGEWIFNFHDAIVQGAVTPFNQYTNDGSNGTQELFYWAPTHICAQIVIKQCQLIKKRYGQQALEDFSVIPGAKFKSGYGWEIDSMDPDFVSVIYPRLNLGTELFYAKKNPNTMWGSRDLWFYMSNHEKVTLHKQIYLSTQSTAYSYLKSWYDNKVDMHNGFTNCISSDYKF